VFVLSEIGGQVECVQSVTVFVVVAQYAVAYVAAQFARTGEQRVVGTYVQVSFVVRLNRLQHVLLKTVQIDGDFR